MEPRKSNRVHLSIETLESRDAPSGFIDPGPDGKVCLPNLPKGAYVIVTNAPAAVELNICTDGPGPR